MASRPGGSAFPGRPRLFAPTLVIVLVLLILGGVYVAQYTDYLWFQEAGHTNVFSTVLKTKLLLFALFGLLMAVVIGANIALAYRQRPPFQPVSLEQQNLERYRVALEPFLTPALVVLSLLFGVFAGLSAAGRWRTYVLFANGVSFGEKDAQFGKDISFFTFTYPFLRFVLGFVLVVLVLSLLASVMTHYLFGGIRLQTVGEKLSVPARVHLSVLIGLIVAAKAYGYYLDRYGLAFSTRGYVEGPGYTDVHAVLPAKLMLVFVAAICAVLFFANIVVRNVLLPAGALALLVVSSIAIGGIYPYVVQQTTVKPNQLARESKYIERNMDATKLAYGITDQQVTLKDYTGVATATKQTLRNDTGTIPNIRLLDPNILGPTFKQKQGLRTYFSFNTSLDIDRYDVGTKTDDFVVAVRELDLSQVPAQQQNWVNLHLAYTHGNGFVAAPANTTDPENAGQPLYIAGDVPQSDDSADKAFTVDKSQIYYGEQSPSYSIVNTKQPEIDGPAGDAKQVEGTSKYSGTGGIKLNTGFRKLLYALKFREKNILLSGSLTSDSKIMYTRSPADRVQKVAPFLTLDGDPYPAVVDGRIEWIVDGYTTSSGYPYSQSTSFGKVTTDSSGSRNVQDQVNYIRNSVKATVDAYDGTVKLYAWDEKDPVLKTWRKVFPGLVKPNADISTDLRKHLRYPEDLFKVQRELLARYHVSDVQTFFQGTDQWDIPSDPTQETTRAINTGQTGAPTTTTSDAAAQPPYYVLLQLPGAAVPSFSLTTTFQARNATPLTAFAAVSSDPDTYGKIVVLTLPRNKVIEGPEQVANTFESNPTVSSALSLLRQGGSEVRLGNLLTLPVGNGLLYVEPVYTKAKQGQSFPILSKVIVSFGNKISYKDTLAEALNDLFGAGGTTVGPTPSPGTSGAPTDSSIAQLAADAQDAIAKADAALKNGDFAEYGRQQARLKGDVDKLASRTGSVPTASTTPSPTPAPKPS
ncbi:MAG: hypothetical protein JWO22_2876 [Frankiales bacterium]|nr:hypothetical protein [Frankiales bacterium]